MTQEHEFINKNGNKHGYKYGLNTPKMLRHYALIKQIEENKSILEMAKLHMNERAVFTLQDRITTLEQELEPYEKEEPVKRSF